MNFTANLNIHMFIALREATDLPAVQLHVELPKPKKVVRLRAPRMTCISFSAAAVEPTSGRMQEREEGFEAMLVLRMKGTKPLAHDLKMMEPAAGYGVHPLVFGPILENRLRAARKLAKTFSHGGSGGGLGSDWRDRASAKMGTLSAFSLSFTVF
jgi:hypothetical protein